MKKVHLIRFDGREVTGQQLEEMMEKIQNDGESFLFFNTEYDVEVETYEFEDDDEIVLANSKEVVALTRNEADVKDILQ